MSTPNPKPKVHLLERMSRHAIRSPHGPGRFAPWMLKVLGGPIGGLLGALWRPEISGLENLPQEGAYLLVANHSGSGVAEAQALALVWRRRFGGERPMASLAHPLAMMTPGVGHVLASVGCVPSTRRDALEALGDGVPVLVFPGGDHEAWRPIWQANRVDLAGRKGFLKVALEAGVPIVPMGIVGSHYTLPILWRSRLLARVLVWPRLLGLKQMPITLLGVAGAGALLAWLGPWLGWGWASVAALLWLTCPPLFFVPIVPWSIKIRVGKPLRTGRGDFILFKKAGKSLDAAYLQVESVLQNIIDGLAR